MEYIIGSGAILERGENGSITPANLHASIARPLPTPVQALAVDFESVQPSSLCRLLIAAQGTTPAAFRQNVSDRLRAQRVCSLADVLIALAKGVGADEVHLFAHWLPDQQTCEDLAAAGIRLLTHPLETIEAAAVVAGQRNRRWKAA
ncbi:MAG TPA: hypothetical protein VFE17_06220 [Candidatus Baltobacteraceae bacterium]|jgi:hypothetical protein|nr:hypothetical protein [Candidatus Baltobacteraceae bacterium]